MCVCAHLWPGSAFTPHLHHSLKGQDALSLVYTGGSKPHGKRRGGGTTTGFIAWHQHVCTGWHAGCRSVTLPSFVLSEVSPGCWGRESPHFYIGGSPLLCPV